MNYFKIPYVMLFAFIALFFQSCSEGGENLLEEDQLTTTTIEIENLSAKTTNLASHGQRATSKRKDAARDAVANFKNIGARAISSLNRNRIATCNRFTNTNTYFQGSSADQKNKVPFYYSVDPNNKKVAHVVITMCRNGSQVVPRSFVVSSVTGSVLPAGVL